MQKTLAAALAKVAAPPAAGAGPKAAKTAAPKKAKPGAAKAKAKPATSRPRPADAAADEEDEDTPVTLPADTSPKAKAKARPRPAARAPTPPDEPDDEPQELLDDPFAGMDPFAGAEDLEKTCIFCGLYDQVSCLVFFVLFFIYLSIYLFIFDENNGYCRRSTRRCSTSITGPTARCCASANFATKCWRLPT